MYTVEVMYEDNTNQVFDHINKIGYYSGGNLETIEGDAIPKHVFLLTRTYHLFADDTSATISDHNLRSIAIYAE